MSSYQQILARAVGSRYGSSASPWQEYSGTSLPELDIPTAGITAADIMPAPIQQQEQMQSDWARMLNIVDPGGEGLRTAQTRYDTLSDQAAALGVDPSGEEEGLLTAAAKIIDIPRAAVFSAGKEIADLLGGGGNGASMEDLREQFNARTDPTLLEEGQASGFGDLEALRYAEDDNRFERGLKAVGAFAGDVLADPLTYVTFGAGAVGKKAMAGTVKATVAQRATALSDDLLGEYASKSLRGRAAAQLRGQTDALPDDLDQAISKLELEDAAGGSAVKAEYIGSDAAEAYLEGGATGMRQFLEQTFGDEGRKLFDSLPSDVRGGARIRVPFAYDQGVRKTINLGGGGGRLAESIGLDSVTKLARRQQNRLRASRAAQTLASTFGGANGELYGKMIADIIGKNEDDLTRVSYHMYDSLLKATKNARHASDQMTELSRRTIGLAHYYLDTAANPKAARTSFDHYMQHPEEVRKISIARGIEIDENGRYHLSGSVDDMPDEEVRGLAAAMQAQDTLRSLVTQARAAGVPMGLLDEYVPRALTDAAKEARQLRKAGRSPKKGRGGGAYDPTKTREKFREPVFDVDPDTGETVINWRDLTPDEANARVRAVGGEELDDLFETDPFIMLAKYADGLSSVVYRVNFAKMLNDSGSIVKAGTKTRATYNANALRDVLEKTDKTFEDMKVIDGMVEDAVSTRESLMQVTSLIGQAGSIPEKLQHVDTISKLLNNASKRVQTQISKASVEDAKTLRKVRTQLKRASKAAKKAKGRQQEIDVLGEAVSPLGVTARAATDDVEASDAITGLGLEKLGQGSPQNPKPSLPPELDEAYAPENFRIAAEKFYKGATGESSMQEWLDRVYRPYLSIFKTSATVGRGPGFHVRNLVGGFWNNYLIDVTVQDHKLSATIQKARISAVQEARKSAAQELADLRKIPLKQARKQVSDEAVYQHAQVILRDGLSKIKVADDLTAYEVHRMSEQQQIMWRQGEQSELSEAQRRVDETGEEMSAEERARASGIQVLFPDEDPSRMQRAANSLVGGRHPLAHWVRANAKSAQWSETFLRDAAFIQGLRRYGWDDGGDMAAMLPKASQFDYHDLSETERRWFRSFALPFYTWQRKNVPLQFRALLTEPGKVNRLMHAVGAAEEHYGAEDQDMVPEWMRERLGFVTNVAFDGNPLVLGVESPVTALNDMFKVDSPVDMLQHLGGNLVSQMSPVIQGPMQFATGQDFFTGADLGELSGSDAPWWYRLFPDRVLDTWDEGEGAQGDARVIKAVETAVPWLNQAQKLLGIGGSLAEWGGVENNVGGQEQQGRAWTEAIRQTLPVVSVATMTPEQEAGMLYGRMDTLQEQLKRSGQLEQAKVLLELGLEPEAVAAILAGGPG